MKLFCRKIILFVLIVFIAFSASCHRVIDNPFWSDEKLFEVQMVFEGERFPNVVVATDGTVIATWGSNTYKVRRSEDGGDTWGSIIEVASGINGGGVTVNENTGEILIFVEEEHPPAKLSIYKSLDHGKTWDVLDAEILPDLNNNTPSMHMNEAGITLKQGDFAGRLIRPTRYYGEGNKREFWSDHYTNAIFSDDGGITWNTSDPFPVNGTGEAALVELSDGRIYYNSRRHLSTDGMDPRMRYTAWSYDGGKTWSDLSLSEELPDGPQDTDYGLMAGLVRLPLDNIDILLFSNVDSTEGRTNGTVWASFDGGKTWPAKRLVEDGGFAYSSMATGLEGTPSEGWIYLLYETGDPYGYAYMARFNLAWVTKGQFWKDHLNK